MQRHGAGKEQAQAQAQAQAGEGAQGKGRQKPPKSRKAEKRSGKVPRWPRTQGRTQDTKKEKNKTRSRQTMYRVRQLRR